MEASNSSFFASSLGFKTATLPPCSPPHLLTISAVQIDHKPQSITVRSSPNTATASKPAAAPKKIAVDDENNVRPPPPSPHLPSAICNALDDIINRFIDPPHRRPSVDPQNVLADNFAPVGELPPTPCPITRGRIPRCLAGGAYIRNGPNPQHLPRGPHHLFDGDGMLHSLLLPSSAGASATLSSRYVHTYKYNLERSAGGPVLPNVFSAFHGAAGVARAAVTAARVLTGQMDPTAGVGVANTSLAFFDGRLLALGESDLPYAVHLSPFNGEISTLGRYDFEGRLVMGMTAHPKKDAATGELFAFRYGPFPPYLTYFRVGKDGKKSDDVPIFSVEQPSFLHDFAITERYAVFPDIQIVMKPADMVLGGGSPVGSDPGKIPRLGVIPKHAASGSEIRWFEVPGFNAMHILNAWDEDDAVVVVGPNVLSIGHALDRMDLIHSCVEVVRIDLGTGAVSRTPLSAANLDFGVINPAFVGRRNRYAYLGVGDPMPKISGVVKLDFAKAGRGDCVVARRDFGSGCFAGEPFFVAEGEGEGEEDEGYVVTYVHDEGRGESRFVVMDARSPELEIVAEVSLPRRVPYGFHGLFVTEAELRSQRRTL